MIRIGIAVALGVAAIAGAQLIPPLVRPSDEDSQSRELAEPINARQQTALSFGQRSHWLQPWRAYLETIPAYRLRQAIGINFNVEPGEAKPTARLLGRSGFRRARVEFSWDSIDFDRPGRLRDPARFRTILKALKHNGIRPLIVLNAHHGAPGPTRFFEARLSQPAKRGARRLHLAPASARRVVPGHTGLNDEEGKAADVIFTTVRRNGTVTLSKPLPRPLGAGVHPAATLRYEPFGAPKLVDGRPNRAFERTLRGWLGYVRVIVRQARAVMGGDDFDVEIWNELSFGSDFLFQERYYDPPRERGEGDVTEAILRRTVSYLRDPKNRVPRLGIGNGFANQTPFPAGSTSPKGLTAIDKHPYYGIKRFPSDAVQSEIAPLDALARPDFNEEHRPSGEVMRKDRFIPRYDSFFPEYILTAIQTEHLIRDISPITTYVYGTPHGRNTHPRGGKAPTVWITEANLDPTGADPADPNNPEGKPLGRLARPDVERLHAKAALRYFTAFVNKGVSAVHLFAVKGDNLALVDPLFFRKLSRSRGAYPGDGAGGLTPRAVRRLVSVLRGATPLRKTRPLRLLSVSDDHHHMQFRGDGSQAHPPLYDRDVLAFFPYQLRAGEYVAAVYVMTRSLAKLYKPEAPASDLSRYDLPPAPFRLTIAGLDPRRVDAKAEDPLTGASVPAKILSRDGNRIVVELQATDSPRLLRLSEK